MNKIKTFEEIDETYFKYLQSINGKNNEFLTAKLKSQLIEEIYCNLSENKAMADLVKEFPNEMIQVCTYWMKEFSVNNDYHGFTACTFKYIKMRLKSCAANNSFDDSTSGMHVSDKYRRMQNTLKRLYKSFCSLRKSNTSEEELNNSFVNYASEYLGIAQSVVIDFLNPKKSTSVENSSDDDETFDITDIFGGSKDYCPDNDVKSAERNSIVLTEISNKWEEQKESAKELLSELLTLIVFEAIEANYLSSGINSVSFIKNEVGKYSFISKKMVEEYCSGKMRTLPNQQDIGERFGLSKSGVSKKISRFFEDLHIADKLKKYDEES